MKTYIGIDNGVSGSIGILGPLEQFLFPTPTKKEQSYTKKKQQITRIDYPKLFQKLSDVKMFNDSIRVFIERPYTNPKGLKATVSGMRALESTLIVVEQLGLSYEYVDSRQWQKVMLSQGIKGSADLKAASLDIGLRLFPDLEGPICKQKDADALLIAEWARRDDR